MKTQHETKGSDSLSLVKNVFIAVKFRHDRSIVIRRNLLFAQAGTTTPFQLQQESKVQERTPSLVEISR